MHFSGHPFTKKVVRMPGPSQIAMRFVSSISGVLTARPPADSIGLMANAVDADMNSFRVNIMSPPFHDILGAADVGILLGLAEIVPADVPDAHAHLKILVFHPAATIAAAPPMKVLRVVFIIAAP